MISGIILFAILAISLYGLFYKRQLIQKLAFSPYEFYRGKNIYSIVTSSFVHADLQHLVFNCISFYFFAPNLEENIGGAYFFLIFMLSSIIGDAPTLFKHRNDPRYLSLGASGGISGIVFGSIVINPSMRMLIFPLPFAIPAYIYAFLFISYSIYVGKRFQSNVNHSAHIWGAISGAVITFAIQYWR